MSLKSIVSGFSNLVFTKPEIEALAIERKVICDGCEVSKFGKSMRCLRSLGGCGCFIKAKIRVPDEECPINKWDAK